jgi:hypothetical protein
MKPSLIALACGIGLFGLELAREASPAGAIATSDDGRPAVGGKLDQTIRFGRVPDKVYLDPDFEVEATASSDLGVRFTASGDCSVRGSTVHLLSAGTCWLTAQQDGDSRFAPAPAVDLRFPIAKADQAIRFPAPSRPTFLDPDFDLNARANSGLPVVLVASGDCSVADAYLHILAAGRCSVTAHQPGDSNFTAARIVEREFAIAKADQTITLAGLPEAVHGSSSFPLVATASSGLPVSVAAQGSCRLRGSTVHVRATGECIVTARQPGNSNFNPAPSVTQLILTQVD